MSEQQAAHEQDERAVTIAIYGRRIEMLEAALHKILGMKTAEKNTISRPMQKIAKKALRPKV